MLLRFRELGIVLALVLVVGATTIDNPHFLSATNVQQILSGAAIIALLAIGETIVIITRNVDLSIGSVLGISAYATGVLYVHHPHVSARRRLPVRARDRRRLRCRQRRDRDGRPRAEPRRDARDALHHPRHRRRVGRRQPGQRVDAARQLQQDRLRHVRGVPVPRDHRDRRRRDRDLRDAHLPHGARLLRDRVGSARRAPRRHPGRVARVPRLRPQRRHRRLRGRRLAVVLRLGRRDRGRRLRVPGDRRGRRRRRGDLRRQRHRPRRRARRAAPEHDQQRARRRERLVLLELGDRGGAAHRCDRLRPADRACASRPPCAPEGGAVADIDDLKPGDEPTGGPAAAAAGASAPSSAGRRSCWCCSAARSRTAPASRRTSSSRPTSSSSA